jgi:hypothetical protein
MKIFYFRFEAVPASIESAEFGGAFINCWLKRDSKSLAKKDANDLIMAKGWKIKTLQDSRQVTKRTYKKDDPGRKYFEQVMLDNEVLVFHLWPSKPH